MSDYLISIPDTLYEKARRVAEQTAQQVDDVIRERLADAFDEPLTELPVDEVAGLLTSRTIGQAMHVEHINPNVGDSLDNLCLSCPTCNLSKAKVTSAPDPDTEKMTALFNPRQQVWSEHFHWIENGKIVQGLTATGRATVALTYEPAPFD